MCQHVLRIAVAVLEHPDEFHEFGMNTMNSDLENRFLAGFADRLFNFLLGFAHNLLDAPRMDSAVRDQPFERDAGDLAANRIVTGNDERLGSIIDDDIDAGGSFDRADVAPLPADDAAFHVVRGKRKHCDGTLDYPFAGEPFDRDRDDAFGTAISFFAGFFFDHTDMLGGVQTRLRDHLVDQTALGFFAGESGDGFELLPRFVD